MGKIKMRDSGRKEKRTSAGDVLYRCTGGFSLSAARQGKTKYISKYIEYVILRGLNYHVMLKRILVIVTETGLKGALKPNVRNL